METHPLERSDAPAGWRAEILDGVLRVVFAIGAVVAAVSIGYSLFIDEVGIALADTAAMLLITVLTFDRSLSYRWRSIGFLALLYSLGLFLVFEVGLAAHVYLMGFTVFAALLLGLRAGLGAVGLVTVTLLVLALVADTGPTTAMGELDTTGSRLVVIANFVFVSTVLVTAGATLLQRVERALAEQQLARAESQHLARAIEQSSDVILLADPSGRVWYANRAHAALVERLGDAVWFEHLDQLTRRPDVAPPTEIARREGAWSDTLVLPDPAPDADVDGTLEFDVAIEAVRGADGEVTNLVGSLYDVTATRRLERRLARAEKLEALGTLASGIAHDFNNIVTGIVGLVDDLRHSLGDDPRARQVELIGASCDRARDVVQQMMVLGRRSSIDQVPVSVADTVRESRPLLRAAIGADVEIRELLDSTRTVRAHPGSIPQALVNLVTNAAQSMSGRGGTVTIEVTDVEVDEETAAAHPTMTAGAPYVVLSVIDDGSGIDPVHIDRIFDPFFTTKQPGEGTGLGLASVHAIVTAAGGEIGVSSEPGVGTTFRIWLPATDVQHLADPSDTPTEPAPRHERLSILLVDDEPLILSTLSRGLVRAGYVVRSARDGLDARDRFDADPSAVDVVVTDLTMPGLGGVDLIRHVRDRRPDVPVVLTSGFAHDPADASLSSLDLTAYLVKPFSHRDLLAVLERL